MNHSVLVTGASSGIGREFCLQVAQQARKILLTGRDKSELQTTANLVKEAVPSVDVQILVSDLCDENQRNQLSEQAALHEIDYVILNAGGGHFGLFEDTTWAQQSKVVELNISSTVHLSSKLIPTVVKNGERQGRKGKLVFISSHASFMRIPHFSVYAACKAFINHFALTLVQEMRSQPIEILVSCPGATESKFSERAGLPKKMLTTPLPAEVVVRKTLKAVGRQNFLIITPFDKILYILSRWLPVAFFDGVIARMQKKLLQKGNLAQGVIES